MLKKKKIRLLGYNSSICQSARTKRNKKKWLKHVRILDNTHTRMIVKCGNYKSVVDYNLIWFHYTLSNVFWCDEYYSQIN